MSETIKGPRKDRPRPEKSRLEMVQEWCTWARRQHTLQEAEGAEFLVSIESVCSQVNGYKTRLASRDAELAAKDARIQELEGQVAILTQEKGYGIENMKLLRAEIATLMSALDEAEKVIQHLLPYAHLNTCTPKSCAVCIVADPALAKIREVRK